MASYRAVPPPPRNWERPRSIWVALLVKGVSSFTQVAKPRRLIWSCGRRRAWAKRVAASCSSVISFFTLSLVSMARVRLRGSSDWRSKMDISCGRPSSVTLKSSLVKPPTMAPVWSVTLTKRLTSFTSMRKVGPSCAERTVEARKSSAQHAAPMRLRAIRSLLVRRGEALGTRFAIGPDHAVNERLPLPDGDRLLESVDQPTTGVEGLRAMGRRDDDQDAGLAHVKLSQPVDHRHVAHTKAGNGVVSQGVHLLHGHLLVGFVVEVQGLAAARMVAHNAVEHHHRAVFSALDGGDKFVGVDGLAGQGGHHGIGALRFVGCVRSSAGDRWQQAHFIALAQDVCGLRVFGIDADGDAAKGGRIQGTVRGEPLQQSGEGGALAQCAGVGGGAEPILQHAKGKNLYLHNEERIPPVCIRRARSP